MSKQYNFFIQQRKLQGTEDIATATRTTVSLWHMIEDYKAGHLILPPHQREKSWSDRKDHEYFESICNDNAPPGSFELYQLRMEDGRKTPEHLNDGSQRLRAAMRFYDQCEELGISKEDAEYILRDTKYGVTTKIHKDHVEALKRFQTVNNNLQLTPYQIVIGDIIYCEGQEKSKLWQDFVEKIHKTIEIKTARIVDVARPSENNKTYLSVLHKLYRHNLSMFFRYLEKNKNLENYKTSYILLVTDKQYFESRLAKKFDTLGYKEVLKEWESFCNILDNELALYEKCWNDLGFAIEGMYPTRTSIRWLLDVSLWRRFNLYTEESWYQFVKTFFKEMKGGTTYVLDEEGKRDQKRLTIGVGRIREVVRCQKIFGIELKKKNERKKINNSQTKRPGWHDSHKLPVSINGEGEMFREPAGLNLERGAKPVVTS